MSLLRELKKLSEESLTRQPEEVFDILSKLGEGSYGCVFKAVHKESSQVLAIKQVPVDTDLQVQQKDTPKQTLEFIVFILSFFEFVERCCCFWIKRHDGKA